MLCNDHKDSIANAVKFGTTFACYIRNELSHTFHKDLLSYNYYYYLILCIFI